MMEYEVLDCLESWEEQVRLGMALMDKMMMGVEQVIEWKVGQEMAGTVELETCEVAAVAAAGVGS